MTGDKSMRTTVAFGLIFGLTAALPATAQEIGSNPTGPYLGAAIGADFYDDDDAFDFDDGGSLGVHLGYRFSDHWRAELEGGVTAAEINSFDDDVLGIVRGTIGLYYDFKSSDHLLVPYIGGGVGVAGVVIDRESVDDDDEEFEDEFTWHAEAGLSLNLNPHIAIVPSYRYTWTDNSNDLTDDNVTSHAARLGVRISF
jgi:opacity protein-like surface antigen